MSRTRMYGVIAAVVACVGLVAGCGGGGEGHTAALDAPAPATGSPAPAAGAPAAAPAAAQATPDPLGSFAPADPSAKGETFAGYQRFPKDRAGRIFVGPRTPATTTGTAPTGTTPTGIPTPTGTTGTEPPVTTIPTGSTGGTGGGLPVPVTGSTPAPVSTPTPAPVTTKLSASLSIDNAVQTVVVGNQVPATNPLFTVQAITNTAVTLAANSGTLPGGGTTINLAVGQPVTLSNPSTQASLVISVVEIKAQA